MADRPWRILLVEDDEDDYLLTRALLADFGGRQFELEWVNNATRAGRALDGPSPDVILVDYALGWTSGVAFIRRARAGGCPSPFILLTGQGDYEIDLEAMQAGAVDYLSKSGLTPAMLERSIRYAIERSAAEQVLRQARQELEARVQRRTHELQERTNQLAAANELLERVFSGIHLMIAYLDPQFNFVRVNQNYAQANGHPPEFFAGKNHFDLYPDPQAQALFQRVIDTGQPFTTLAQPFTNPEFPEQGTKYWDWSLQPVREADGRVSGLVLNLLDVTERERTNQALQARDQLLRAIVTGAPVILWAVDAQGVVTLLEGRGLEKLGLAAGELVGCSTQDETLGLLPGLAFLRRALDGDAVSGITRSASGVNFYTNCSPQYDGAGQVTGAIAVSTDITEQVQAELQLAYQADLLDRVSDAIIASDAAGRITTWNQAAEAIYGWGPAEAVGQPVDGLLQTEFVEPDWEMGRRTLAETGRFQGELVQRRRDGQPLHIEVKLTAQLDEHGQVAGFAGVYRDITERKGIQAELAEVQQRLMEGIEAERQRIARELHDGPMQELYALAYEVEALRSPAVANEGLVDALQGKLRQVSQALRETATELRPPTLAPFGLEKAIRSHAERYALDHPELRVRLELDRDGQSLPERVRLALFRIYQQAMVNILRHAQAGQVDIRLVLEPNEVTLEIQDNGQGFEVPARWVELARTGHLGLVGAQERAGAVGGTLTVTSGPGSGTRIRVTAPRAAGD